MPTVQTYGERKVSPTPLPGVRLTAAQTPESLGAGLDLATARTDEAIAGVGAQVATIGLAEYSKHEQEARDQADLAVHLQATSDLSAQTTQQSITLLNLNGKAASGPASDQALTDWNTHADTIAATLSTDRQRQRFAQTRAASFDQLNALRLRHGNEEGLKYTAQAADALVANKGDEAILNVNDPRTAMRALTDQIAAIKASGAALGQSPEVIQLRVGKTTTDTAHGLIMRALDNGNLPAAAAYYKELGPGTTADPGANLITGDKLGQIEKALLVGQAKSTGIKEADAIIAGGGTLAEQLAKTKTLDDGPRVVAEQRIEHAHGLQQQQERQTTEATLSQAYDTLTKSGGDLSRIPPSVQSTLATHMPALRAYANTLSKGEAVETDWPTYYARLDEAGTDPQAFATRNVLADRAKLGNAEFKQLADLQLAIRKGDRAKADQQLAGFRTHDQIVTDSLRQYGIDPASKDPKVKTAIAELRRQLDQQVQTQESLTGKKPTNPDIQSHLDKLLAVGEHVPGSWWALVPGSGVPLSGFTAKDTRAFAMTIRDVPAAARAQIETSLKTRGRTVSDTTILDLYLQGLGRK